MNRLLCRLLGHRWRWKGWLQRGPDGPTDCELFECTRCPAVSIEEFGG